MPQYKFNEVEILDELKKYIDSTYEGHYAKEGLQFSEVLVSCGVAEDFFLGNIMKYAMRFGKKDSKKKEALKIAHYAILLLNSCQKEKEDVLDFGLCLLGGDEHET